MGSGNRQVNLNFVGTFGGGGGYRACTLHGQPAHGLMAATLLALLKTIFHSCSLVARSMQPNTLQYLALRNTTPAMSGTCVHSPYRGFILCVVLCAYNTVLLISN